MLPNTVERAIGSLPAVVRSGRRVNGLFRLMKCPSLWDQAYQKVASNKGAMTPGVDGRTFDGYSPEKVRAIIARLTDGTHKPAAVRRVFIPKADGRRRPLGIPTTRTGSSRKWCGFCSTKSMTQSSMKTVMGSEQAGLATRR